MTPEGRVKKMVKRALDILGADCWRFMPVQTGFGVPALDYLLSIRGHFVAIETKAPGKKLTPLQEGTKAAIEAAGGIVLIVWDETSLELAMKIILALEFANAPQGAPHLRDNLQAVRSVSGPNDFVAQRIRQEAKRPDEQYLCTGHASDALDAAAGRDTGAPGAAPQRRPKSKKGGDDRGFTAAVTDARDARDRTCPRCGRDYTLPEPCSNIECPFIYS